MRQALRRGAGVGRRQTGRIVALDVSMRDPAAARLLGLVSRATGVPTALLLHKSRCTADVAQARQLAMYLMHVALQRTYEDIGRVFRRERTTVSHACAITEDRRDDPDDPAFEALVASLEAELAAEPPVEVRRAAG